MAVWGCGPVGQFAIQSALIMGAHRVIAIDHHPHRLELARSMGAEVINYHDVKVREALFEMTGGIGPDAVIDAVGMESHGFSFDNVIDAVKTGQTHVQKYMPKLLEMIGEGEIDTTYIISHRLPLEDAPKGYKMFKERQDEVTKVVLKPDWQKEAA